MDNSALEHSKPINFGIAIWGIDFCQKFLDNCLASLLASGNIPALPNKNGNNKFIFCTTAEDWQWLQSQTLFQALSKHLKPEFMPINMSAEGDDGNPSQTMAQKFQIVSRAHADLLDYMYHNQAIGSLIFPDTLYANNSLKNAFPYLQKTGKKAVLACVPRLSTPDLLDDLSTQGYIRKNIATEIPNRTLVKNALKHMNTEVLAQNWDSLYAFDFITDIWKPLKKDITQGIVTHSFAWCPIFLDYSKLSKHNIECLENNTIDGAYLYKNFAIDHIHALTDSDEFLMISYSPHTKLRIKEKIIHTNPHINSMNKIAYWRRMIEMSLGGFVDPLKLELLKHSIIMHTEDLSTKDLQIRNQCQQIATLVLQNPGFKEKLMTKLYYNRWSQKIISSKKPKIDSSTSETDKLVLEHAI